MWFMNHLFNPFVSLILRSPLHGMMSGAVLLISIRGRKSGKVYTLPVQFAQSGDTIVILPGESQHKTWWRNLRGGAPVRLLLRGKTLDAQAIALVGVDEREAIAKGLAIYLQRFPALEKSYHLQRAADGSLPQSALLKLAESTVLVRVRLDQA